MNADTVKEALLKIRQTKEDFTLVFSGKNSKKVNGLYKPESREIVIHNRNFQDDNMLMYTAIHEYAHHLHYTDDPALAPSARSHTNAFWCLFHGLLARAEALGIYRDVFASDAELVEITNGLRADLREMAVIMKRIGRRLLVAAEICKRINARFEDYIDRVVRMNRITARLAMKAHQMDVPEDFGPDGLRLVASTSASSEREAVVATLAAGKSQDEAKAARKESGAKRREEPEGERLGRERERLRKTIASLTKRLEEVEQELGDISGPEELDFNIRNAS